MLNVFRICLTSLCLFAFTCPFAFTASPQEPSGTPSEPAQRITGTISAVDQTAQTVSVKEDKTGTVYAVELQDTKSLRKVDPATLDLKKATRITGDDLMVGDRVQVFASKADDNANALAARAVILISARDLQTVHQEQSAAWQHSTGGVATQIDPAGGKLSFSAHTAQGVKPVVVDVSKAQFTRYSPDHPKTPVPSQLGDIQVGDQVRVIGDTGADESTLTAQKVYSSGLRMIVSTVSAVSADGKRITVKDLQTKQPVVVTLNDDSAVRKLPLMMAMGLARRLNPAAAGGAAGSGGAAGGGANGQASVRQGEGAAPVNGDGRGGASGGGRHPADATGGPGGNGGAAGGYRAGGGMRNGDLSQMLDRIPKIGATDLKPGDAVMVTGTPVDNDKSHLLATNVIAGVEPIFQAASPRQMQSLGDWGLSAGAGSTDSMPSQ